MMPEPKVHAGGWRSLDEFRRLMDIDLESTRRLWLTLWQGDYSSAARFVLFGNRLSKPPSRRDDIWFWA
jgi:hypothetical protein